MFNSKGESITTSNQVYDEQRLPSKQSGFNTTWTILLLILALFTLAILFYTTRSTFNDNLEIIDSRLIALEQKSKQARWTTADQVALKTVENGLDTLDSKVDKSSIEAKAQLDDLKARVERVDMNTEVGQTGKSGTNGTNGTNGNDGENGERGEEGSVGETGASGSSGCILGECVSRQASTPGIQETGNINISGTAIIGSLQGDGAGLTSLSATNISSGQLDNNRLSGDVSLLGQDVSKDEIANSGGLGFDWANSEVANDLTISDDGTVADGALSSNIALLDRDAQTFTGNTQSFRNGTNSTTSFQVSDSDGGDPALNVDTTNTRVGVGTSAPGAKLHVNTWLPNTSSTLRLQNNLHDIDIFATNAAPGSIITGSVGDLVVDATNGNLYLKTSGTSTTFGWSQMNRVGNTPFNSFTAAFATNSINNADMSQTWNWNTLSGTGLALASTSTAATGNAQKLASYSLSGANSTSTQTTYGTYTTNAHTGTLSTNVAGYFSATNGTNNYAGIFDSGNVGIGETSPATKLHIKSASDEDILRLQDSDGTCNLNPEAGSLTTACSSDESLKSNIQDAEDTLDEINKYEVKDYTIKASGDSTTGVIAQDVQKALPEKVHTTAGGKLQVELPNPWTMVRAIQEIDARTQNGAGSSEEITKAEGFFNRLARDIREFSEIKVRDIEVTGHQTGNDDTRGEVIVKAGQTTGEYKYKRAYDDTPFVTATPLGNPGSLYWVKEKSETGFTIELEDHVTSDVKFDFMVQQ